MKISKHIYYMTLAFAVSRRSIDPSTKHGCVIVSEDGRILSTGYNGPIKGSVDQDVRTTRPDKYKHFLHSEENAVINYYGSQQDIENGTAYITGMPCTNCLRMLLQKGVTNIVYAPITSNMLDEDEVKQRKKMLEYQGKDIFFAELSDKDMEQICSNLNGTIDYVKNKTSQSSKK